jgi:arylsulfatase A-like enzyme
VQRPLLLLLSLLFALPAQTEERPNIVLLSVDTLRADRLGCYGYDLPTSPQVDKFAGNALLFEDALCEVPLTFPSMGAMLTSRYPRATGTTRNGLRMPENVPTIAEAFQKAGYHTFCVQSNWTLKGKLSKMDRGFDVYDDKFRNKRWGLILPERISDQVNECTLEQLAQRPDDKPFFAWIHYSDPHAPYKMHKGFNPSGKKPFFKSNTDKVRIKYDSEVAYTDHKIAEILAALPENTAVVFVADHGESLYEHDYLGHGRRVYQDNLRIPLIIRAPGLAAGRSRVPVRGVDIAPTLLGLAGIDPLPGMVGLDILRANIPLDRVRVLETYGGAVPKLPGAKAVLADAKPIHVTAIHEGWKVIVSGRKTQLYHLPDDPGELNNLVRSHPDKVEALKVYTTAWEKKVTLGKRKESDLNEEDLEALKNLGYLE